jgi:hypothetical protein
VEIKILDLQAVTYGNPCRDLLEVLYYSTSGETREQTPAFLNLYHDTLVATACSLGVTLEYSYQDFQKDVDELEEYGFLMSMIGIPLMLADKADVPDYTKTDLDTEGLIKLTEQQLLSKGNAVMMQRIVEVVEDMVRLGVLL